VAVAAEVGQVDPQVRVAAAVHLQQVLPVARSAL
jgi:hypothetical protein